jgi:hypothetical protein
MLVELGLVEQRYRAVCEVLDGATVTAGARRNGVARGLIEPTKCRRRRSDYKRWERSRSMEEWAAHVGELVDTAADVVVRELPRDAPRIDLRRHQAVVADLAVHPGLAGRLAPHRRGTLSRPPRTVRRRPLTRAFQATLPSTSGTSAKRTVTLSGLVDTWISEWSS